LLQFRAPHLPQRPPRYFDIADPALGLGAALPAGAENLFVDANIVRTLSSACCSPAQWLRPPQMQSHLPPFAL